MSEISENINIGLSMQRIHAGGWEEK